MTEKDIIPLCIPEMTGQESIYVSELIKNPSYFLQKTFYQRCKEILEHKYCSRVFLTHTCTSALEIICLAEGWGKGDEIIMPSFTYVSTANAFSKFGVTPVFVDIEPLTLNINPIEVKKAITKNTKAVIAVHYAGISCDLDALIEVCKEKDILLIEDAAHAYGARYKGKLLGSFGTYGAISFDHTKVIQSGQGGALLVNNLLKEGRVIQVFENGTNKNQYTSGHVPYFEWVSEGSKCFLSDLNCAFLLAQLEAAENIIKKRVELWNHYFKSFIKLQVEGISMPLLPTNIVHNGYQFHIQMENQESRNSLRKFLRNRGVESSFHFIPLHSSIRGLAIGRFSGLDQHTSHVSSTVLRLPLYSSLEISSIDFIVGLVHEYMTEHE